MIPNILSREGRVFRNRSSSASCWDTKKTTEKCHTHNGEGESAALFFSLSEMDSCVRLLIIKVELCETAAWLWAAAAALKLQSSKSKFSLSQFLRWQKGEKTKQNFFLIDLISLKSQVFDSTDISQYNSFVQYFDLLLDETK